ncbi:MAG: PAS domain-containing protein [Pseudomonadota bacterium]
MAGLGGNTGETDADILDLTGPRLTRSSPVLEEAWRYWSSLRKDRGVPLREDLDPRSMTLTLGHSMILDRVRPGTVRVRLGGRVMNSLMGMEVRGLPIRAFFEVAQRDRAIDLVEQVFETPATLEMDLISETPKGKTRGRMLVLPLCDGRGTVTKALTCVAFDRVEFEPPHRFSILRHALGPIAHGSSLFAARGAQTLTEQTPLPREAAEDQAPYTPKSGPKPWLRVVK